MGDTFRHPGRERQYPRGQNYAPHHNESSRYDHHYEAPSRSAPRYGAQSEYYDRPRYDGRNDEYHFRGAANGPRDSYMPQHEFSFRTEGYPAPSFPPEQAHNRPDHAYDRNRSTRPPTGPRKRDQRPGFAANRDRRPAPRRFVPKPAHQRDLLNREQRGSTPEQLPGMNADMQPRFKAVNDVSDSSDGETRVKRVKVDPVTDDTKPKWSNPDPYTALPPTDATDGPKRDIVQVIRKGKVDAAKSASNNAAIAKNEDFISFDWDEDESQAADEAPVKFNGRNLPSVPEQVSFKNDFKQYSRDAGLSDAELQDTTLLITPLAPPLFAQETTYTDERSSNHESRPSKRKRVAEVALDGVLENWLPDPNLDSTPWFNSATAASTSTGLRLHKEICDFYDYVRPRSQDQDVRLDLIARISKVITMFPELQNKGVEVHAFGSFASGLYLPVADMDLVAMSATFMRTGNSTICDSPYKLRKLNAHISVSGIAKPGTLICIAQARVPLIKFVDRLTGLKVDLSFENASGLRAISTFEDWKRQYPAMPAIVVLIKQLLAMHGQNEVVNGGLGGYTIICLVVSMMQIIPELQSGAMQGQAHYGDLLMNFLELYGNRFDYVRTGISLSPPQYFDKRGNAFPQANPDRLTIIDPNNPSNDVSGGSRNVADVLNIFRLVHSRMQSRLAELYNGKDLDESILGCCWAATYTSFANQRHQLGKAHGDVMAAGGPVPALQMPDLSMIRELNNGQQKRKRSNYEGSRYHKRAR